MNATLSRLTRPPELAEVESQGRSGAEGCTSTAGKLGDTLASRDRAESLPCFLSIVRRRKALPCVDGGAFVFSIED